MKAWEQHYLYEIIMLMYQVNIIYYLVHMITATSQVFVSKK